MPTKPDALQENFQPYPQSPPGAHLTHHNTARKQHYLGAIFYQGTSPVVLFQILSRISPPVPYLRLKMDSSSRRVIVTLSNCYTFAKTCYVMRTISNRVFCCWFSSFIYSILYCTFQFTLNITIFLIIEIQRRSYYSSSSSVQPIVYYYNICLITKKRKYW